MTSDGTTEDILGPLETRVIGFPGGIDEEAGFRGATTLDVAKFDAEKVEVSA